MLLTASCVALCVCVCCLGSCLISSLLTATAAGVIWMQRLGDFHLALRGTVRHCHWRVRETHTSLYCTHTITQPILHTNTLTMSPVVCVSPSRHPYLQYVCVRLCVRVINQHLCNCLSTNGSTSTFFKHKDKDKVRTCTTMTQAAQSWRQRLDKTDDKTKESA